jgi:hypothetical protein
MPKYHPDHRLLENLIDRLNQLLQPLRIDNAWQKRLRLLQIQEAIHASHRHQAPTRSISTSITEMTPTPDFDQLGLPVIVRPGRWLVDEARMYKVHKGTGGASAFVKVFLLNDILIYAHDDRYTHDGLYHGVNKGAKADESYNVRVSIPSHIYCLSLML